MTFGELVRAHRKDLNMSLVYLAEQTGVSRSQLIRWEAGDVVSPDPPAVRKVCKVLEIDPRHAVVALGYMTREEAFGEHAPRRELWVIEAREALVALLKKLETV
jgi:transcriptional regulator with XRE-family HTH domain